MFVGTLRTCCMHRCVTWRRQAVDVRENLAYLLHSPMRTCRFIETREFDHHHYVLIRDRLLHQSSQHLSTEHPPPRRL